MAKANRKTKTRKKAVRRITLPFYETGVTLEDLWKKLDYIEKKLEDIEQTVRVLYLDH